MPLTHIDHVQLAMPPGCETEARHFYASVLGMREMAKPPHLAKRGGAWFSAANVALHLGVDADFRPATKAHPALSASGYHEFVERLERQGVLVTRDATPFGNRIEIVEE